MASPGRPSRIADDDFCQQFAELLAEGLSRQDIADVLQVKDLDTITKWKRDPRVKSRLTKLINERVQEVTRKVDAEIAARLARAKEMSVDELLRVRKEFLGGALRDEAEKADEAIVNAAFEAAESPEFQAAVDALKNM